MIKLPEIYFIRHGKLSLEYKSHAEMPRHVLAALGLRELDPPADIDFLNKKIKQLSKKIPLSEIGEICISPSRRCVETAEYIADYIEKKYKKNIKVTPFTTLKEVKFDLNKICNKDQTFDFKNLNLSVFRAMISGMGSETVDSTQKRVARFFFSVKNKQKKVLVITHDFTMRIIEIYINQRGIKKNIGLPDLINTQRNDYLSGFELNRAFKKRPLIMR